MTTKYRYVEVSYGEPPRFRGVVVIADSPRQAAAEAVADAEVAHPGTDPEEFLQRVITEGQAVEIERQLVAGTWEGWPLGTRTI